MNRLPTWNINNLQPAFNDLESATVLDMTSKLYKTMQNLIDEYNTFVNDINANIEAFESSTNKDIECFKNNITKICHDYIQTMDMKIDSQDKEIAMAVDYMKTNINQTTSNIISDMINNGEIEVKLRYDNVSTMKEDTSVLAGEVLETLGYYNKNDGAGSRYLTRQKTETDVEDNGAIHFLKNNLVAELIVSEKITVNQFGAKGDGVSDDTVAIQKAMDYAMDNKLKLEFVRKTYIISNSLVINRPKGYLGLIIDGNNAEIKTPNAIPGEYLLDIKTEYTESYSTSGLIIQNLYVNGNYKNKGINIDLFHFWSLKNVQINECLVGLRLCNTYYGNVDNNTNFHNCFYGILFDDSMETTLNEVNTIYIGNCSFMMRSDNKSQFTTDLTESVAVKIDTMMNTVKFIGCVIEHYDHAFKNGTFKNSPDGSYKGSFTIDRCYIEKVGKVFEFKKESYKKYFQPIVEMMNCRIFPQGTVSTSLKGSMECGDFNIHDNQPFTIVIGTEPMKLSIKTDMDDLFMDLTNINTGVKINKIGLPKYTKEDAFSNEGYVSNGRSITSMQENNNIIMPVVRDGATYEIKNYKALSVNAQNIAFHQEGAIPVGLIINGEDGKKYMLSTEDGTALKLVPMNNMSRVYHNVAHKDALWLWMYKDKLPEGTEIYCRDLESTLVLTGGRWIDKKKGHIAIGTSKELNDNKASNPQNKWWCACWDISFNRCVYYNVTTFDLGYDYFKNNDPYGDGTAPVSILVYGTIANRPETPAMKSYYYATDEEKYYKFDGTSWTEFTPDYV